MKKISVLIALFFTLSSLALANSNSIQFSMISSKDPVISYPGENFIKDFIINNKDLERTAKLELSLTRSDAILNDEFNLKPEYIQDWQLEVLTVDVSPDTSQNISYEMKVPESLNPGKYAFVVSAKLIKDEKADGITIGTAVKNPVYVEVVDENIQIQEVVEVPVVEEITSDFDVKALLSFIEVNISYINLILILLILMKFSSLKEVKKKTRSKSKKK